jgi:hypothetical protein
VKASCDEACQVEATGKVVVSGPKKTKVSLKRSTATVEPSEKATLKPKLTKKSLQKVERALDAKGAEAKAKLKVTAVDSFGAETTAKRAIKLKD